MYRFYLDNIKIDDPEGWDESRIKIARHSELRALVYEYISDVVFIGSGYTYILNKIANDGYCSEIVFRIEKKCNNNYSILFTGIIKLSDIQVDEWRCKIIANAEPDTLINKLIAYADAEFYLTNIKGIYCSVAPPTQMATRFYDKIASTIYNRYTYHVSDCFSYLLKAILGCSNTTTFVSDYFQTQTTQRQIQRIKFNNVSQITNAPDVIEIKFTNYFGEQFTRLAPCNVVLTCALETIAGYFRQNPAATDPIIEYYRVDYDEAQSAISNGSDSVYIQSDLPFKIDSLKINGVTPVNYTLTETNQLADGMQYLSLLTGAMLRNSPDFYMPPLLSLKNLFDEMNKHFNLGMRIRNISGTIEIRIEPIEYFFNTSSQVTLNNVPELKYELANDYTINQIKVGDGSDKSSMKAGIQATDTWSAGGACIANKKDCKNEFISNYFDIDLQLTSTDNKNDDKIYLVETELLFAGQYGVKIYEEFTPTSLCPSVGVQGYILNGHLTNYWKLRRWLFNAIGNWLIGLRKIINHNKVKPLKEYTFSFPLTFDQLNLIRSNESDFINFVNNNISHNGFIEELEYDIKRGVANFKLITV